MPFRVRTATASRWWSLHTVFNTHCLCRNLYYSALSKRQVQSLSQLIHLLSKPCSYFLNRFPGSPYFAMLVFWQLRRFFAVVGAESCL